MIYNIGGITFVPDLIKIRLWFDALSLNLDDLEDTRKF